MPFSYVKKWILWESESDQTGEDGRVLLKSCCNAPSPLGLEKRIILIIIILSFSYGVVCEGKKKVTLGSCICHSLHGCSEDISTYTWYNFIGAWLIPLKLWCPLDDMNVCITNRPQLAGSGRSTPHRDDGDWVLLGAHESNRA